MTKKMTTSQFIERARKVHGDKYDYSKTIYGKNTEEKVKIICPKHGEFLQSPHEHLSGRNCPLCAHRSFKYTTEEFIVKAKNVHGVKYDYSKTEYVNLKTNVCITCPKHGDFWQLPSVHLNGGGCKECRNEKLSHKYSFTTDQFIEQAKKIHGDKYDYSKVNYINNNTNVCIICPIHGETWQRPANHLRSCGCLACGNENSAKKRTKSAEEFIENARKIHGDKYDYSKVEYNHNQEKVCIICPTHGEFWQTPNQHLQGHGCLNCVKDKNKLTTEEFIKLAREIHGDIYDYSKTKYVDLITKVCIICPKHGEFYQTPKSHLEGHRCPNCARIIVANKNRLSTEKFIKKAQEIHGDKYDYSKVKYVDTQKRVHIICPKHGEFIQTPNSHIRGAGCPMCKESKLEVKLRNFLLNNDIEFIAQKRFDWLRKKNPMSLDFYLPKYNIAIECQGIQHFKQVRDTFFNEDKVKNTKINDKLKKKLCEKHGIKIFYYSNLGIEYPYKVYEDLDELLKEIKEHSYFETMKEVLCEVKQ